MSMNKSLLCLLLVAVLLLPYNTVKASTQQMAETTTTSVYDSFIDDDDQHIGDNFCTDTNVEKALRFLGYIVLIVKILVPLMLIIVGTFDYLKVVTGDKPDDMKKQTQKFGKRILAGLIIFFLPTIINLALMFVSNHSDTISEYEECASCLFDPTSCGN